MLFLLEPEGVEKTGIKIAAPEDLGVHYLFMEGYGSFYAGYNKLVESPRHS